MTRFWRTSSLAVLALALTSCSSQQHESRSTTSGCSLAPRYSAEGTVFGTSLSSSDGSLSDALATNESLFGHLPIIRQFDPEIPTEDAWTRRLPALGGRSLVTSFRSTPREVLSGVHDDALLEYFRSAPRDFPIFWSYYHEPEPAIDDGLFTADEYRDAWKHLANLVAQLCRNDLYPTLILTGWTADERSERNWRDYYPGDDYISVLAWDPYNSATEVPSSYAPPAEIFAPVIRISEEAQKPWGIAETGSALVPGDNGAGRAEWLHDSAAYLKSAGASFVIYFQSTRDGYFKLEDVPSLQAWRHWVRQSNTPVLHISPGEVPTFPYESGTTTVKVSNLGDGRIDTVKDPREAFRFPAYSRDTDPPRAVLAARSSNRSDAFTPHSRDFSFGADVALDSISYGTAVDNGDNVIQRGLSSDSVMFKLELDSRRPACTVRGSSGELIIRSENEMVPERWYRVSCHRHGSELSIEVIDLDSLKHRPAERTRSGQIGAVSFDPQIPVAIGGKLAANGELIRSATDQFNGMLTNAFLSISP